MTAAILALLAALSPAVAHGDARPIPNRVWTHEARHTLARALVAEADYSRDDHAAMAWVLAKRWPVYRANKQPVTFARYVRLYVSLWKGRGARKREIRALPWGPSGMPHGGRAWDSVRRWVSDWSAGKVPDPCPRARHWGSPGVDSFPVGARVVFCGDTRNRFYFEGARSSGRRRSGAGGAARWEVLR